LSVNAKSSAPGESGIILLLTACIAPKPEVTQFLRRSDPMLRLRDYESSLQFWLGYQDERIKGLVLADNSGHPLDSLRAIAARHRRSDLSIEFHSFDHPGVPATMSYGYSEAILVRETLRTSALLASRSHFAKVTGRYCFPNLSRLLDQLPADFRVAVDTTGCLPWPFHARSNPFSNFALALFENKFYRDNLEDLADRMVPALPWNRLQYIETMLYDHLWPRRHEPGIILRWPCNCEPVGIGANGNNYRSPRRRLRAAIRAVNRVVLPSLWL